MGSSTTYICANVTDGDIVTAAQGTRAQACKNFDVAEDTAGVRIHSISTLEDGRAGVTWQHVWTDPAPAAT